MIVVIDTNIWISALQFSRPTAPPRKALEKAMRDDLIATCEEIEAEVLRTLTTRFDWPKAYAQNAIEAMLLKAIRVRLSGGIKVCRDPHDDIFLDCAQTAGANLLVTGDKDLLVLGSYKQTRIVTSAEYLNL